jgi:hypothetical protein
LTHLFRLRVAAHAAKRISALPGASAARALPDRKILFQLEQIGRTEPARNKGETPA